MNDIESIYQSRTLEYFDGIEKQFLPMGDYSLVIMNMDPSSDNSQKRCMHFTLSVYVEEEIKKKESKRTSGMLISESDQNDDALSEAVIESMTLCQNTFIFDEIYKNQIKVNGGILSIDSVYRFDNDERKKRVELDIDTNSVIYIQVTDLYGVIQTLEVSLNVVLPNKNSPYEHDIKVVANKKSESKLFQSIEIQQFVKKGKYQIDLSKSVFDVNTDLFPCNRLKFEVEVRPLKDVPGKLKDQNTCKEVDIMKSRIPKIVDPKTFNEFIRLDEYYPITQNVLKVFKFKVEEPMFLIMQANFEKEMSGGSIEMTISHIKNSEGKGISADKNSILPVLFTSDTSDGTLFAHERLEPYLSG